MGTILAFLRITTSPGMRAEPFTLAEAIAILEEWLEQPNVDILAPGERHWKILVTLIPESQARSALVMDAHLAALALEHGAILCSNDRDFSRFSGVRVLNPLTKRQ